MLRIVKRPGSPFWYVRGAFAGRTIFASTKERDKADARRFKDSLEIELARSAGQKCHAATFQDAARFYLEARPGAGDQWRANIERLCAVIGDRLLTDIRQHVLVDAANALYPNSKPSSKNCAVFAPAAAVLHCAADNDLCPYIKVKKFKAKKPEPRAIRKEDAARLISAADGKLKLLLIFLFAQGWRISDVLRLQWTDINFAESTVRYHISKTDEWLTMPLHVLVLDMLCAEPQPRIGRVFPWRGRHALYRHLRPLCLSPLHAAPGSAQFRDVAGSRRRIGSRNHESGRLAGSPLSHAIHGRRCPPRPRDDQQNPILTCNRVL